LVLSIVTNEPADMFEVFLVKNSMAFSIL